MRDFPLINSRRVRDTTRIVPHIVGLSLSMIEQGLTFTLAATADSVAALDGMQYLTGGPCDQTLRTGKPHEYVCDDDDNEDRWPFFTRATAAAGVKSTLSLPVFDHDTLVAGINIYASTSDAFNGKHSEIAKVCGAWIGGVIANTDLGFTTRFKAARAATRLRETHLVDKAVGVLMSELNISPARAQSTLESAAQRSGLRDPEMARAILALLA